MLYYNQLLSQQGWEALPLIIIIAAKHLQDFHMSQPKSANSWKQYQTAIKYLTHIIFKKQKLEKKQALIRHN